MPMQCKFIVKKDKREKVKERNKDERILMCEMK